MLDKFCQTLGLLIKTLEIFKVTTTLSLLLLLFLLCGSSKVTEKRASLLGVFFFHSDAHPNSIYWEENKFTLTFLIPYAETKLLGIYPCLCVIPPRMSAVFNQTNQPTKKKPLPVIFLPVMTLCIRNIFRRVLLTECKISL